MTEANKIKLLETVMKESGLDSFKYENLKKQMPQLAKGILVAMAENVSDADSIRKIESWRREFSLPVRHDVYDLAESEWELAETLIREEYDELIDAIRKRDYDMIADGAADLFFVLVQLLNTVGIDPVEAIQEVYDSNMSKLCTSNEEAQETMEEYAKKGVDTYLEVTRKDKIIVKRFSDGKVLKSINFREPNWNYNEQLAYKSNATE